MSKLFLSLLLVTLGVLTSARAADKPEYAPVDVTEFVQREGCPNALAKMERGEKVVVAYLGGSITAANGWRPQTTALLQKMFPKATIKEVHAAIGGTGSDLGVFRLQRDVLQHKPDLLFVEFAVNDGSQQPEKIWQSMEGIVRQTWAANPKTDICFVYTYRFGYEKDIRSGKLPRAAGAMEMLAEYYGIPTINFNGEVVRRADAGTLVFKSEKPTEAKVLRFSKDGVHPLTEGHRIYSQLVGAAFEEMRKEKPQPRSHAAKLDKTFVSDHWQAAKMVPLTSEMLQGDWKKLDAKASLQKRFGNRMGQILEGAKPGSKITFRFKGSQAKLYDLLGPDGGGVWITVDGKRREKAVPRFDSYCTYHRIAALKLAENLDPNVVHTITLEIDSVEPDRQAVAFRLKNPAKELQAEKFRGTKVRASSLLLIGELVE